MTKDTYCTNIDNIKEAASYLSNVVHRTPVLTCKSLNELTGLNILFKCENFQKVGAFKFRGASYTLKKLEDELGIEELRKRGVTTHSSGNHAQALALAAKEKGIPAYIVMPSSAPQVKKDAVKGYNGIITECAPTLESRETTVEEVIKKTGAIFVHPYNNPNIITGQGTAMYELVEQAKELGHELDAVIAPIGGGGLLSGTCISAKGINPEKPIPVFVGEPKGADDCYRSLKEGKLILMVNPKTCADGLLTSMGEYTYPIIRDHVEKVFTVSEEEIRSAQKLVLERMKIVIEPSSAVPVAALFDKNNIQAQYPNIKTIGVIISGGNIDLAKLFE
ncbi:pyridoxal-phosphate dependent enzyme superfamily [Conidiobolus coronatus NRRL 28638]|uniref:Pyridoxal-phosphate dependent enzyme superfamily n=1 Tax=Conidiobolus coronatus (strain ATCC 28846 / CBS 209.66 / NRRL 28638) TaxID=796925 RepID=A0A137PEK2_CONC2|nr:pyridoxal-phosphate dependent enzyme superfamily [Conidiobolus coronatus NRRL 28638]|eukprot:KXN73417.1 pyridoxal-phosphate dependent enzyme superfamily [Conidiobolus coronatus NRRL 28638]